MSFARSRVDKAQDVLGFCINRCMGINSKHTMTSCHLAPLPTGHVDFPHPTSQII